MLDDNVTRKTPLITPKPNTSSDQARKIQILKRLNLIAFALHFCSFVAALGVTIHYAGQSIRTQLTTDFKRYDAPPPVGTPPQAGNFSTTIDSRGFYPVLWVDLPFPLITSLFHLFIALVPSINRYYNKSVFTDGPNALRWIEYSITASLMTWVIMQLSGITNVFLLVIGGVVCNIALQFQGWQMEQQRGRTWVPMITGWFIFLGQWSTILAYFFTAISSPRPMGVEQAPWYVYSIVIGLFFIFCIFGLIQLAHFAKWPRFMASSYNQEIAYIVMSFTSKLYLTWNLAIGSIINPIANST